MPNIDAHFKVSMVKSGIRILGYILLFMAIFNIWFILVGIIVLVVSEIIGIVEEFTTEEPVQIPKRWGHAHFKRLKR